MWESLGAANTGIRHSSNFWRHRMNILQCLIFSMSFVWCLSALEQDPKLISGVDLYGIGDCSGIDNKCRVYGINVAKNVTDLLFEVYWNGITYNTGAYDPDNGMYYMQLN